MNKKKNEEWREFDVSAQDIEMQKDGLIDKVSERLKQNIVEKIYLLLGGGLFEEWKGC